VQAHERPGKGSRPGSWPNRPPPRGCSTPVRSARDRRRHRPRRAPLRPRTPGTAGARRPRCPRTTRPAEPERTCAPSRARRRSLRSPTTWLVTQHVGDVALAALLRASPSFPRKQTPLPKAATPGAVRSRTLVGLRVRTDSHPRARREIRHALQIYLELIQVETNAGVSISRIGSPGWAGIPVHRDGAARARHSAARPGRRERLQSQKGIFRFRLGVSRRPAEPSIRPQYVFYLHLSPSTQVPVDYC